MTAAVYNEKVKRLLAYESLRVTESTLDTLLSDTRVSDRLKWQLNDKPLRNDLIFEVWLAPGE